jgi:hypothetical protein
MNQAMFDMVFFILGAFVVMWLDIFWWHIDFKKVEKGLEWHEHYHVGLELIIVASVVSALTENLTALYSVLLGAGFLFLAAEWRQAVEIKGKTVIAGHPFAYGSKHFKTSTIFGIALTIVVVISHLYLVDLVEGLI